MKMTNPCCKQYTSIGYILPLQENIIDNQQNDS